MKAIKIIEIFDRYSGGRIKLIIGNRSGAMGINTVVLMSIALFIFAILGAMGLNELAVAVNGSVNAAVKTVAVTVVSILFSIGVALRFLPKSR